MQRITEQDSAHRHLEKKSTKELLRLINQEDQSVAHSVERAMPQIENLVNSLVDKMLAGGRLFYIGSGTSGRLGILDASECPPTFGVDHNLIIGIIAGGDKAIRKAQEFAEDDTEQGIEDLAAHKVSTKDLVLGIAASGTTPYVVGALESLQEKGIATACITCNPDSPVTAHSDFPIVVKVGPEFVTGSTRMKSGTAQKLVLNMISTTAMIKLGRVKDNKMVDMQLTNNKLVERGIRMIVEQTGVSEEKASILLDRYGSVRTAILNI